MEDSSRFNSCVKKLMNAGNLFRWELHALDENRHEEGLDRADGFFRIVSELLKIHHEYNEKNFPAALQIIYDLEIAIKNILEDGTTFVTKKISRAVDHVVHISKATILLHCGKTNACFETQDTMSSNRDLNEIEEAAILAIHSACCALYSYKGMEEAKTLIDHALQKDPKTPFWRFLKALFLYKTRTALNPVDPPSLEELEILKKLNEEEKNSPLFMVYLADIYRESANANKNRKELDFWYILQESRNSLKIESKKMYAESKTLYEDAYKLRSQCPFIAFRCANGLMKLPQQYQNIKVAKEILTHFQDIQNDGFGNIVTAFYHYQFGKKLDLAKNYLGAAMKLNVFNAHINNIKLIYKENSKEFDINVLKKMLDMFEEAPKRKVIYAQMISYFLFIKVDLKLVCQTVMEYLKIGGPRNSLERHVSCFLEISEPFSLIDVVTDQIKFTLNMTNLQPELRKCYDNFVYFTLFYNLNIDWTTKPQNFRKQILDGKIPEMKSKFLQEPRSNTNPKHGFTKGPNQTGNATKTQYRKSGFPNAPPKDFQYSKNKPGPPNPSLQFLKPTNQTTASHLKKEPNLATQNVRDERDYCEHGEKVDRDKKESREPKEQVDRDKKEICEPKEQVDRDKKEFREPKEQRNRHSSVSDYSDHGKHSRGKKHRRRRTYLTSSSESESRDRRRRSPSPSRRHRRKSKEHRRKRRDRRHSTSSGSSSASYDRYEERRRKYNRRHSYSDSGASSSERYEKKKCNRHNREPHPRSGDDERNLRSMRKKMTEMSLDDRSSRSRKKQ